VRTLDLLGGPLPAIIISVVKAAIALMVQTIARPKVVNNTEATVELRNAPTNSVKTEAQVAAAPMAPSTTAASSAIERQRRRKSCRARSALSSGSACSIDLVICATRSATRASRVANTLSRVAMPESRKIGVRATWMTWATRSSDAS
jgi:hypothetical protein